MSRRAVAALCFSACLAAVPGAAPHVGAQVPAPRSEWTVVRVTKWALLAAAVGFGAYALSQSTSAEDAYDALRALCADEPESCHLEAGRYLDGSAEGLYQRTLRADRRAQLGIAGGQVALLGSVALFIYDLRNGRGPDDIPYPAPPRRAAPPNGPPAAAVVLRVSF